MEKNLQRAFEWTQKAADQGHVEAQANLGSLYLAGEGVEQDIAEGVQWLESAAKAGHPHTAFSLATMLLNGDPVQQDLIQAHAWASQAEYNQHAEAAALKARIEDRLDSEQLSRARRLFARWQIEQ